MWGKVEPVFVGTYADVAMYVGCGLLAFLVLASMGLRRREPRDPFDAFVLGVPMMLTLVHLLAAGFVNNVAFHAEHLGPPIVAATAAVLVRREELRRHAPVVLLFGAFAATFLSIDPMILACWRLPGGWFVYLSTLGVVLMVSGVTQLAFARAFRRPLLAVTGLATFAMGLLGGDVNRLTQPLPDTTDGWGTLLVCTAFVLLVAGIVVTFRFRRYASAAAPPM